MKQAWISRTWTAKEEQFLKNNYGKMETYDLEKEMQRSAQSIYMRANKLKLKKR